MQIEQIAETDLTPTDDTQINALLRRAFGDDFGDRSFYQQRHTFRLLIRQDTTIIGHMALGYRAIRLGDTLHNVIGLAEVATDPDYRGQGIATKLMTAAIEQAKSTQAAFFLLFGDQALYAASGFQTMNNPLIYVDYTNARTGKIHHMVTNKLMVLPLGDQPWDQTAPLDLLGHAF